MILISLSMFFSCPRNYYNDCKVGLTMDGLLNLDFHVNFRFLLQFEQKKMQDITWCVIQKYTFVTTPISQNSDWKLMMCIIFFNLYQTRQVHWTLLFLILSLNIRVCYTMYSWFTICSGCTDILQTICYLDR